MKRHFGRQFLWALCLLLGLVSLARPASPDSSALKDAAAAAAASPDPARLNEYGISLALARDGERAEAAFLSILSGHRGDSRAYNNLGNLHLMKGDYGVALSYYERALSADTMDAGVHMNRAAVLLLLGDEEKAVNEAALASRLAGGDDRAGELVGLRAGGRDSSRAAEKKLLSPAQMRELLRKASRAVPSGSVKPPVAPNVERGQGKRTPVWRSGTTRADEAPGHAAEAGTMLYWKR